MNTDRELMQQALEAMMTIRPYEVVDYDPLEASIAAMRERLARDEERQYDADHVVLEKGTNDCVCTHCGQRYHIHMPVPMSIMTAIVDETLLMEDACTNALQENLDNGWRIIAVCPQPQRRPDYILGRKRGLA